MLNILLPSLPYQRVIDPMWQEEADVARNHGYAVCLFDADQGKLYQQPKPEYPVLYRGWMLSTTEYQQLAEMTPLLISTDMYLASHRANGWYDSIAGYTPRSRIVATAEADAAIDSLIKRDGRAFIKGLSKSFGSDSIVFPLSELSVVLKKHDVAQHDLLFVREFVELSTQPEQRFFVVRDEAFCAGEALFPEALKPALEALRSRWFYTVDVAYTRTGQPIIIEVGDGQVSDIKEWTVAELYSMAINRLAESATN